MKKKELELMGDDIHALANEVKARLDIVDVIGGYVALTKNGIVNALVENYVGHCPFHEGGRFTLAVFPSSQTWHCFGECDTGGDIFIFVMRKENVNFTEAVRLLAKQADIPWPTLMRMD
jgi:DNA primase